MRSSVCEVRFSFRLDGDIALAKKPVKLSPIYVPLLCYEPVDVPMLRKKRKLHYH